MQKFLVFLLPVTAITFVAAEPARVVNRAVEVPGVWTAGQHLYVKGNVLPAERLAELEACLLYTSPSPRD